MADVKNSGLYLNCRESSQAHTDLRDRIEKLCLALAAPDSPMPNLRHEAMWTVAQLGTKSELALKMYRTLLTNKDTVGEVLSYAKVYREGIGLTEQEIKDAEALKESPR